MKRIDFALLVYSPTLVFLSTGALTVNGNCAVISLVENAQITSKYVGGCKNGKAEGVGEYTASFVYPTSTVTAKVSGVFKDGMLNGRGQIENSQGTRIDATYVDNKRNGIGKSTGPRGSEEGTWRGGQFWDGIKISLQPNGVRKITQFAEGKSKAWCNSDRKNDIGSCTPDLLQKLDPALANEALTQRPSTAHYWQNFAKAETCQINVAYASVWSIKNQQKFDTAQAMNECETWKKTGVTAKSQPTD